eukprot:405365_1
MIDGREQLTLCGVQKFPNGGYSIWGKELEERHNHLLPDCQRHVRSKSHVFSVTLMPTREDAFEVEYVLQLEVGGNLPYFLTTPILIDTIKGMFRHAESQFKDEKYMAEWFDEFGKDESSDDGIIKGRLGLLLTP